MIIIMKKKSKQTILTPVAGIMAAITSVIMPLLVVRTLRTSRGAMTKPKTGLRVVESIMITFNVPVCHRAGK